MTKEGRGRGTVTDGAALAVATAGPRLVTLAAVPFGIATFGSATMGTVFLIEAVMFYIALAAGGFVGQYAQQFVATGSRHDLSTCWWTTVLCQTAVSAVVSVGALLLAPVAISHLLIAAALSMAISSLNPAQLLRGQRKYGVYLVGSTLQTLVFGVSIAAFFVALRQPVWYFLAQGMGVIASFLVALVSGIVGRRPGLGEIVRHLRGARHIGGAQLAIQLYTNIDLLLVGSFLGTVAAGAYGAAYKYHNAVMTGYSLLVAFAIPRWSRFDVEARLKFQKLASIASMIASLGIASLSLLVIAPTWPATATPARVLAILSIQLAAAGVAATTSIGLLLEDHRGYLGVSVAGAISNVSTNLIAIPTLGLPGAASATAISELVVTVASRRRARVRMSPEVPALGLFAAGILIAAWGSDSGLLLSLLAVLLLLTRSGGGPNLIRPLISP